MTEGSDYRKRAEECTALARAQRTMLLHIADTWRPLACEDEEQTSDHTGMLPQSRLM